jgi:apolipoprotein N-acyltransferase
VPSAAAAAVRTLPRQRWSRGLLVVVAGLATGLSWEPYHLWPLLLVGLPAFTVAICGLPPRRAFAAGYLYGLMTLTLAINWIHVLGFWVAVALIVFEALFFGILGLAITLTSRLRLWPLAAACCWVLVEFTYSRIPFGGFGWTRIAYAVVDTPLAGFFPFIGVAGVSFLTALIGQLIAYAVLGWLTRSRDGAPGPGLVKRTTGVRQHPAGVPLAVALVLVVAGLGLRLFQLEPAAGELGSVRVGIVQGNVPGRGIEAMGRARSVTNNHLSETIDLVARARLGAVGQPDFLLWPENSTDIDPLQDRQTNAVVRAAAGVAGIPILVGAVTRGPGSDERQTTAMWWDPQRGVTATYQKRNLVPFGEWIPFRKQLLPVLPILEQVGAQSVPGTQPGVMRVQVAGRDINVGDIICFELAYDRTVYETVTGGAQVLMVQSNNATYGGTGQIEQQFAITRARAMETRRDIAVATTNSVSGYIDRNGHVQQRTNEFTAQSLVVDMPLRSAMTPAVHLAPWLDRGLAAAGLLFVVAGLVGRTRRLEPDRRDQMRDDKALPGPAERALEPAAGASRSTKGDRR